MGRAVFPPCCLTWGHTLLEVMETMLTSFTRPMLHWCPSPATGHRQPAPPPETPGHSQASLCQSLVWSLLLSPGSCCIQDFVCVLQESVSQSCVRSGSSTVGLSGDLLQEGLCHTQVCCTQSPCPCGRPLLTSTSTGDTQAQFWLSLCEVSGFWGTQGLFEPSEHLWWVWSLNLNMILPLLLSSWGFSFALGHGVSFLVRSNILFSVVVQQRVVILEFSQEKMGTLLLHQDGRVEGHELTECICVSHSVMSDSLWPHGLYSLPGSSVHGIFQARILEWVAISFSRGSSQPRDWIWVSCIAVRCFTIWATREAPIVCQILF